MLTIRREQLALFEHDARARFRARLCALLRAEYPRQTARLSEDALAAVVDAGLDSARTYGMSSERAVGDFVSLSVQVGPQFHRHPLARAVLEDRSIPAEHRVQVLAGRLSANDWQTISAYARQHPATDSAPRPGAGGLPGSR